MSALSVVVHHPSHTRHGLSFRHDAPQPTLRVEQSARDGKAIAIEYTGAPFAYDFDNVDLLNVLGRIASARIRVTIDRSGGVMKIEPEVSRESGHILYLVSRYDSRDYETPAV